jgi:hypothetical protein
MPGTSFIHIDTGEGRWSSQGNSARGKVESGERGDCNGKVGCIAFNFNVTLPSLENVRS